MANARREAYSVIGHQFYGPICDDEIKGPRIQYLLPSCVKNKIRRLFPDPEGRYTGYVADYPILHCMEELER